MQNNKYFRIINAFIANANIARNNANFVRAIPTLENVVTGELMKDYLFNEVYSGLPVATHTEEGWAYHHQAFKLSPYSFDGNNTIIVKDTKTKQIFITSFKELFMNVLSAMESGKLNVADCYVDSEADEHVYVKTIVFERPYRFEVMSIGKTPPNSNRVIWTPIKTITQTLHKKSCVMTRIPIKEKINKTDRDVYEDYFNLFITDDHPIVFTTASDSVRKESNRNELMNEKIKNDDTIKNKSKYGHLVYYESPVRKLLGRGLIKAVTGLYLDKDYSDDINAMFDFIEDTFIYVGGYNLAHSIKDKALLNFKFLLDFKLSKNQFIPFGIQPRALFTEEYFKKDEIVSRFSDLNLLDIAMIKYEHMHPIVISIVYEFANILKNAIKYVEDNYDENSNIKIDIEKLKNTTIIREEYKSFIEENIPPAMLESVKANLQFMLSSFDCYLLGELIKKFFLNAISDDDSLKMARFILESIKKADYNQQLGAPSIYYDMDNTVLYEYDKFIVYDIGTGNNWFLIGNVVVHNCIGLSAESIAFEGLQSDAKNSLTSAPPKRLDSLFAQCANLICLIAQEVSGATSLNDLSTIAAGYLWYEETKLGKKYSKYDLINMWQSFLFNINLPFRNGNSPFSNITLDFAKPNARLKDHPIVYAGQTLNIKYSDIPAEYFDRINEAFIIAMEKGDGKGNPMTFPLITVNLTEDFDYNNAAWKMLLEKSEKFGGFYVQNYLKQPFEQDSKYKEKNPFIKPFDEGMIYSNCCLLPETEVVIAELNEETDANDTITATEYAKFKVITFRRFKDTYLKDEKPMVEIFDPSGNKTEIWYDVSNKNLYVPSLNTKTKTFEFKKINKFLIKPSRDLIIIRTASGKTIECEPTHRVAIFDGDEVVWKYAENVKAGEYLVHVACPDEVKTDMSDEIEEEVKQNREIESYDTDFRPIACKMIPIHTLGIETDEITTISRIKTQEPIEFMDFEIEDNETFLLANGLVSFNCRMLFNIDLVETVTGSNPFHSGAGVGGIGVYAINMNRILYVAKTDFDAVVKLLDYLMDIGARALQRKRKWIMEHWDLYPYLKHYQKSDKSLYNIFSIIGVHEGMINAGFEGGLFNDDAKEYAHKIAQYILKKLEEYMHRDQVLYSLEYAPSENAAVKLAKKDLEFGVKVYRYILGEIDKLSQDKKLDKLIKSVLSDKYQEFFVKDSNNSGGQ